MSYELVFLIAFLVVAIALAEGCSRANSAGSAFATSVRVRKTSRISATLTRLAWCLAVSVATWHCGSGSPVAPDLAPRASAGPTEVAFISGQIYTSVGPRYPVISGAVVEVNEADGSSVTVVSDAAGLYRIPVRRGAVTATVSKAGYQPKQWQFDLMNDTVLNFGLDPQ